MIKYKQLTAADRKVIEILLRKHFTPKQIAKELGVDKTTVCREIKSRATPNGYFANIAQIDYETKRKHCGKKIKISQNSLKGYIENCLRKGWSPEQIIGRMELEKSSIHLCVETIYRFIYFSNYGKEQKLYQYLRFGRKKRKKQKGRNVHCEKIPNRVSIHLRPEIVKERTEFNHWEGDSVIYNNKKAINTLNELKSGIVAFTKLDRKTAENTKDAVVKVSYKYPIKTLTFDNGTEFTQHEEITKQTGIKVYFADPYSSWQRGANENGNMLLRGYLPKRSNIDDLTQEELNDIAEELNNRPRKRLGYRTPNEVYLSKLNLEVNCCS